MQFFHSWRAFRRLATGLIFTGVLGVAYLDTFEFFDADSEEKRFRGATSSQPLAMDADGEVLLSVNPDNNSVTVFDIRRGDARRRGETAVGAEPSGVAVTPDGKKAYIANTVSGTVTVAKLRLESSQPLRVEEQIPAGTEPWGVAVTPNGEKIYVTNARSNNVTVIDTRKDQVVATIPVGPEPRGLAITNDGDGRDDDETVYVTHFLSVPASPAKLDGEDDAKAGLVTAIRVDKDEVAGVIRVNPIADTGFKAAGDAIGRIAPPATPAPEDFKFLTGAYPNQLANVALRGNFAYLPNTGASPNGPVRFDVNTQSLLSVLDLRKREDAGRTINMHAAVARQTNPRKLFVTVPWAMAFKHGVDEGYVVSAASNIVVKVKVNPVTGAPEVLNDPEDPTRVLQLPTGKNPRGIVITPNDARAFVWNYISRDITEIDLTRVRELPTVTLQSAALPAKGSPEEKVHIGKELYNTSVGVFDPPAKGAPPVTGRMSNNGWGACSSCHPFGLSDNVVWIFPAGPRRTISQHADFDLADPERKGMRMLNWSANRDEQEDFELNIRGVSGGPGLIVREDGVTPEPNVQDFLPLANGARNQLEVRGVPAWDALKAYIQFGVRAPISPVRKDEPEVIAGAAIFKEAGCQKCHGGASWTTSRVAFNPPPQAAQITAGQLAAELRPVGTFDPALKTEVRQNAAPPLGAAGFVPPSLLSTFMFADSLLHNGAAATLDQVLENVAHRSAGTGATDTLGDPDRRKKLVRFLLSIDASTPPIN